MLTERFDRALKFASDLHRRQTRKSSPAPYLAHLLGVCALVLEDGGSEDEAIAALLHDSVEDQSSGYPGGAAGMHAHILEHFGAEVLRLVEALTERPNAGVRRIPDKRERWRAHKQAYINRILSYDASVRRISCADSLYYVRSMISGYRALGDALWRRFATRTAEDQIWAYQEIARAFVEAGGGSIADDLRDAVNRLASIVSGSS